MGIPESDVNFLNRYIFPVLGVILFFWGIFEGNLFFMILGPCVGLFAYFSSNIFDKGWIGIFDNGIIINNSYISGLKNE